jgi:hypothetical protein
MEGHVLERLRDLPGGRGPDGWIEWSDGAHGPGLGDAYDRVKHGQIRSEAPSSMRLREN